MLIQKCREQRSAPIPWRYREVRTVSMTQNTYEMLKRFGKFGESWDDLLLRLAEDLIKTKEE